MKRLPLIAILVAFIMLAGCTFVRPQDAATFDRIASNARAYSASVQGDATVPTGVQRWIKEDAAQWTNEANWANGRPATVTTQP